MTATQTATVAAADHVINAPREHIALEPPECLLEILEVLIEHLTDMLPCIGIGWKVIELEILNGKTEKRLPKQNSGDDAA